MKYSDNVVESFSHNWTMSNSVVTCFLSNGFTNSFTYRQVNGSNWYNAYDLFVYISEHYLSGTDYPSSTNLLGFTYTSPFYNGGTHNYFSMELFLTSESDFVFIGDNNSSFLSSGETSFIFENRRVTDYEESQSSEEVMPNNYYSVLSYSNTYDVDVLEDSSTNFSHLGDSAGVQIVKGKGVIVDYSNFDYSIEPSPGAFVGDYVQPRSISFNLNFLYIQRFLSSDEPSIQLTFGNAYNHHYRDAYLNGVGVGEDYGFSRGYDKGYEKGFYDGSEIGGTAQTNRVFGIISGAFNTVSSVMSLEILPNVTVGLAFSIPMVFILIMTIFKLVRK